MFKTCGSVAEVHTASSVTFYMYSRVQHHRVCVLSASVTLFDDSLHLDSNTASFSPLWPLNTHLSIHLELNTTALHKSDL